MGVGSSLPARRGREGTAWMGPQTRTDTARRLPGAGGDAGAARGGVPGAGRGWGSLRRWRPCLGLSVRRTRSPGRDPEKRAGPGVRTRPRQGARWGCRAGWAAPPRCALRPGRASGACTGLSPGPPGGGLCLWVGGRPESCPGRSGRARAGLAGLGRARAASLRCSCPQGSWPPRQSLLVGTAGRSGAARRTQTQ